MLWANEARKATLAAFKRALSEGVPKGATEQVAFAKYRAYFPSASETEARSFLANVVAADRVLRDTDKDRPAD